MIRPAACAIVAVAALVVGCGPAATPSPVAHSPSPSAPPATSSATVSTSPAASIAAPSASPARASIPGANEPWAAISWERLPAGDPLEGVSAVTRWSGGFVAIGAPVAANAAGTTSRTPVSMSADGVSWRQLDPAVFGSAAVVIGVAHTPTGIVALTLQGGRNQCDSQPAAPFCSTLAAPLQAWTSQDGSNWAAHAGPAIELQPNCDGCGIDPPQLQGGTAGLLVSHTQHGPALTRPDVAVSRDGVAWDVLPSNAFPTRFNLSDVAATSAGFIVVGSIGGDRIRPAVLASADGHHWTSGSLSTTGLPYSAAPTANQIVVGPGGVIVIGSDGMTPGTSPWWSSVGGGDWKLLKGYPPLGVWSGEGAGTGLIPNGVLLGDGERMVAYRGGDKPAGWTSTDGRTWQALAIDMGGQTGAGDRPVQDFLLTPIGILAHGSDGATWLGHPAAYHEAVVLHAPATMTLAMPPDVGTFVARGDGAATCDSMPDGRTVATITGLDLGTVRSGRLRGTLSRSVEGSAGATAEFWIDGGSLPEGAYQPFWAGPVQIVDSGVDGTIGHMAFAALKREADSSVKPGDSPASQAMDGWPATLSGTLSWTCRPW